MNNSKTIARFVRELKGKCIGYENINGNKLYQILRKKNILYYDENKINLPKQEFINKGYFEIKTIQVRNKKGEIENTTSTFLTEKGQHHLLDWLVKSKYIILK